MDPQSLLVSLVFFLCAFILTLQLHDLVSYENPLKKYYRYRFQFFLTSGQRGKNPKSHYFSEFTTSIQSIFEREYKNSCPFFCITYKENTAVSLRRHESHRKYVQERTTKGDISTGRRTRMYIRPTAKETTKVTRYQKSRCVSRRQKFIRLSFRLRVG